MQIVLQAHEHDLAEYQSRINKEELEEKRLEIENVVKETKESIRQLSEQRSTLMTHVDADIKPKYISIENQLKKLENANEMKLEVK